MLTAPCHKKETMTAKDNNIISDNIKMLDVCRKMVDRRIRAVFDDSTIDEDGNMISFNEQAAIVTHYLQLHKNGHSADSYADKAKGIIDLWKSFMPDVLGREGQSEWMASEDMYAGTLFDTFCIAPFQAQKRPKFKFIDLFAGIGGFRMAFQNLGGECVFSSEWDEQAQKTYYANTYVKGIC